MNDWTPEPWNEPCGVRIEGDLCHKYRELSEPDWERAKACVNDCAGIPTEALEAGVVRELVKAAREVVKQSSYSQLGWRVTTCRMRRLAAAIAKAQPEEGE